LSAAAAQAPDTNTTFKKALTGITAPAASGPLPNIGQGSHLLTVMFKTATADVTGIVVRIEASYDNATFFPISEDVTTAKYTGAYAYGVVRGNGNFPYVRIRAVTAFGAKPMDAWYTGSLYPIANVSFSGDRFIVTPPGATGATGATEPYIYHVEAPIPSQWTSYGFNSTYTARTDQANGVISLSEMGNGDGKIRMICTPLTVSPPYKLKFMLTVPFQYGTNDAAMFMGAALRNSSTNKVELFYFQNAAVIAVIDFRFTPADGTINVDATPYASVTGMQMAPTWPITMMIWDDGTLRRYRFWDGITESFVEGGGTSRDEYTFPNTQYTGTPDQACLTFNRGNANYKSFVQFMGFEQKAQ
jgi:hypothetical protein